MSLLRAMILTGFFLSIVYAVGQDAITRKPDAASSGDEAYSNDCLGLLYHLPDGWKFAKVPQAKAREINQKTLFEVKRNSATASAVARIGRASDADAQTSKLGTINNLVRAVIRSC